MSTTNEPFEEETSIREQAEFLLRVQRDLGVRLGSIRELDEALGAVLDAVCMLEGVSFCSVYLIEAEGGDLKARLHRNLPESHLERLASFPSGSQPHELTMTGKAFFGRYDDVAKSEVRLLDDLGVESVALIPFGDKQRILGTLALASCTHDAIPPVSHDALEAIASQIGGVVARIETATALRESEERYRGFVRTSSDGVVCFECERIPIDMDPDAMIERIYATARFIECNETLIEMYGYGPEKSEEIVGCRLETVMPSSCPENIAHIRKFIENGFRLVNEESIHIDAKGRRMYFVNNLVGIVEDGCLYRAWGTARNITQRKRAEEMVAKQQMDILSAARLSALGTLASGVAHEVNNPLAIIAVAAEQLAELSQAEQHQTEGSAKLADTIIRNVARIKRIVRGLQNLSSDGENDPFEVVSVRRLVEDTLELCQLRFRVQGIVVEVGDIPPELKLECRGTQISQVLMNLLNNAYDAVEPQEDKWVSIDAAPTTLDGGSVREGVRLEVTDCGPTLPEDLRAQIFEPFFTTKRPGKGSGLGLSISKRIVEDHDGRLELDQTCENTRFVVVLPKTH